MEFTIQNWRKNRGRELLKSFLFPCCRGQGWRLCCWKLGLGGSESCSRCISFSWSWGLGGCWGMRISWNRRLCPGRGDGRSICRGKGWKTGRNDWLRCIGCDQNTCKCGRSRDPDGWCWIILSLNINKGVPKGITGDSNPDQYQEDDLQALMFLIGSAHIF